MLPAANLEIEIEEFIGRDLALLHLRRNEPVGACNCWHAKEQ